DGIFTSADVAAELGEQRRLEQSVVLCGDGLVDALQVVQLEGAAAKLGIVAAKRPREELSLCRAELEVGDGLDDGASLFGAGIGEHLRRGPSSVGRIDGEG